MKTIYKYPLEVRECQQITMPQGAKILTLQIQNDELFLWAEVDTHEPRELREFVMHGTGQGPTTFDDLVYIATIQSGPYVWHFYEEPLKVPGKDGAA